MRFRPTGAWCTKTFPADRDASCSDLAGRAGHLDLIGVGCCLVRPIVTPYGGATEGQAVSETNQKMRPAMVAYVGGMIVAGVALLLAASATATSWEPYSWRLFVLYVGLAVFAECKPLEWFSAAGAIILSASWPFMVAIVFIAPFQTSLITIALVHVVVNSTRSPDTQWFKVAFNAAQHVLSLGIPIAVVSRIGMNDGWVDRFSSTRNVIVILVVAVVSMALNDVLVACVYALVEHQNIFERCLDHLKVNWVINLVLLVLTPNVLGATEITGPILGVVLVCFWFTSKKLSEKVVVSETDSLTGIPNRRGFLRHAEHVLKRAARQGHRTSLLQLDLNGFKEVNDQLGHATGDGILKEVAERLQATRRPGDVVARLGGDEFVVLLQAPSSIEDATALAARMRLAVREPIEVAGLPIALDVSIGFAEHPTHSADLDELLDAADAAMYRSKKLGNGPEVYSTVGYEQSGPGRRRLVADMQHALEHNEFFLVYQPKLHLPTNTYTGVEALIRWNHPQRGLLNPGMFMPVAEQTEIIVPITEWVLATALQQCAAWHTAGIYLTVAVNVSARNLHHRNFFRRVTDLLADAKVDPIWLELELTENTVMADRMRTELALAELRGTGIKIALDDFGTGFSTFNTLAELTIDRIKIDRSFVMDMATKPAADAIARTVIDLAARLHIDVVAEGVETQQVLDLLRGYGCHYVQGYYTGYPNDAATIAQLCSTKSIYTEE
jgi:diguanylate cyclase